MPEYYARTIYYKRNANGELVEVDRSKPIPFEIPPDPQKWYKEITTLSKNLLGELFYPLQKFFIDYSHDKELPLPQDEIRIVEDASLSSSIIIEQETEIHPFTECEDTSKQKSTIIQLSPDKEYADIQIQVDGEPTQKPAKSTNKSAGNVEPVEEISIAIIESNDDKVDRREEKQMETDVRIIFRKSAMLRTLTLAKKDTPVETGGALLGKILPNKTNGATVVVTGIVHAHKALRESTSVNITADTWADIWRSIDLDKTYKDEKNWRMVGWYHTHPNFGIFYSSWDQTAHQRTFRSHGQIGLVIDPDRNEHGFFCWDRENRKVIRCPEEYVDEQMSDAELLEWLNKNTGTELLSLPDVEIDNADVPSNETKSNDNVTEQGGIGLASEVRENQDRPLSNNRPELGP